jgi:hypothetical protein
MPEWAWRKSDAVGLSSWPPAWVEGPELEGDAFSRWLKSQYLGRVWLEYVRTSRGRNPDAIVYYVAISDRVGSVQATNDALMARAQKLARGFGNEFPKSCARKSWNGNALQRRVRQRQ